MEGHVFHVHLMNVVVKGTEGQLVNIAIHAHHTWMNVRVVNLDTNSFQGHVFHVHQMNVVVKGTEVILFQIVIHAVQT